MRTVGSYVSLLSLLAISGGLAACDDPIDPTPVCSLAISPSFASFTSDGGPGTVALTASDASCSWAGASSAPWISILSGSAGTGTGTINYRVAENGSLDARTGALTIGNLTHTVMQAGRAPTPCSYTVSPDSSAFDHAGGERRIDVTTASGCFWTTSVSVNWITVTNGFEGMGDGTVSFRVDRNRELSDRTATITVVDQMHRVSQAGEPVVCDYSVAPVELTSCMAAGTVLTRISAPASCSWTASANVPWLALPGGASGNGTADVNIAFSENYDAPREGVVMLRWPSPSEGQNVRVSQAGCIYGVTRTVFSVGAAGGAQVFDVVQQSDPQSCGGPKQDKCTWTAVSDVPWIVINSPPTTMGDGRVSFTAAPNSTGSLRAGAIRIRDKVVQVTQTGQ